MAVQLVSSLPAKRDNLPRLNRGLAGQIEDRHAFAGDDDTVSDFKFHYSNLFRYSNFTILILCISLLATCYVLRATAAWAAPTGITISPPLHNVTISETEKSKQLEVEITNNTDSEAVLEMSTRDFKGLESGAGVQFLGTDPDESNTEYLLTPWMTVSPDRLVLQPGQTQDVTATITNDPSLSPGGHYAAIIGQVTSDGSGQNVSINQAISSLLFINKQGGEVYGLTLANVLFDLQWWGQTDEVTVAFTNEGNTHVIPRGSIKIYNPLGQTIANGTLNQTSTIVMPQQEQSFTTQLDQQQLALWPGNYSIEVLYRYDGQEDVSTYSKTVFLVGLVVPIIVFVIIASAIAWYFLIIRRRRAKQ